MGDTLRYRGIWSRLTRYQGLHCTLKPAEHNKLKSSPWNLQKALLSIKFNFQLCSFTLDVMHSNVIFPNSDLNLQWIALSSPAPEFIQTRILHFLQRLESNPAILVSQIWRRFSEIFSGCPFCRDPDQLQRVNLADQPTLSDLFEKTS